MSDYDFEDYGEDDMDTCSLCGRDFPFECIDYLTSNKGSIKLCAICALKEINKMLGLPESTPFIGKNAINLYEMAIAWLSYIKTKN